MKTLALITLLALTLVINIPNTTKQGNASPPPQGNYTTFTVYPDGSVAAQAQMYNTTVPYLKNINVTHYAYVSESFNGTGTVMDSISPSLIYVGRNASVLWWYSGPLSAFNHTVTIKGPQPSMTTVSVTVYSNASYLDKSVRFNTTGTYTFWAVAKNATAIRSSIGQVIVISAEENEIADTNFGANLSKQSSEVLLNENFNRTFNTFQKASLGYPFNNTDSISVAGTYQNGQDTGTITVHEVSGVTLPLNNITLSYTSNSTFTVLSGTIGITLNPSFPVPLTNKTFFSGFFNATLGNATWINNMITVPLNSTTAGRVQLKSFTVTPSYNDSKNVVLTIKIVLKGDWMRFLFLGATPSTKLTKIYSDTLAAWPRTDYTITYTRSSGLIVAQSTSHFPLNLDSQFNTMKSEFLNYTNATTTPAGKFLNKTYIWISSLNIQEAFTKAYTWQQVWGLVISPPTVPVSPGKFEEFGLFNYTGYMSTKVNFTLIGGSNGTNVVTIDTTGVPTPTTSSPTMDTWSNFQNFTKLAPIVFSVAIQTASAPTNLVAAAGDTTVTLTWSTPSSLGGGISHYGIYRGTTPGGEILLTTTVLAQTYFSDSGLTDGQVYYYKVAAIGAGGTGPLSSEVSATPSAALANINENPFTLTTNSSILNWTYNATSGVASFQVNGTLGMGYLKIAVPKTLAPYANNVTITFDGTVVSPTITSDSSNYYFTLTPYQYTTHNVKITIALASTTTSATTPFPWLIVGAVLIIIILAGGGVYWYSKRKPSMKMPSPTSTSTPTKP